MRAQIADITCLRAYLKEICIKFYSNSINIIFLRVT